MTFAHLQSGDIVTVTESGFQPDDFEVAHVSGSTIYVLLDSVEQPFRRKDGVGRGSKRLMLKSLTATPQEC